MPAELGKPRLYGAQCESRMERSEGVGKKTYRHSLVPSLVLQCVVTVLGQHIVVPVPESEVMSGERDYYAQSTTPQDSRGRPEREEGYRNWGGAEASPCTK